MIQIAAEFSSDIHKTIAVYLGAKAAWEHRLRKSLTALGEAGVARIQTRYRTGGTTADRTAVRTGRLRRSYGQKVAASVDGVTLDLGLLKSSADSRALVYGPIHEGVVFGTIDAPQATKIDFKTHSVTIPARPGIGPVGRELTPKIAEKAQRDFEETLAG